MMNRRSCHRPRFWMLTALLLASTTAAQAANITLRGSSSADRARMVFDWPEPVGFNARIADNRLLVTFDQPIDAMQDGAATALSAYLGPGRIEADKRTVAFEVKTPTSLRSFRIGNRVVLDLTKRDDGASAVPAGNPDGGTPAGSETSNAAQADSMAPVGKADGARVVPVRAGTHPGFSRLVFDFGQPTNYQVTRNGNVVTLSFDRSGRADFSAVSRMNPPQIKGLEQSQSDGKLSVALTVSPDADLRYFKNKASVVVDVIGNGTAQGQDTPQAARPGGAAGTAAAPSVPTQPAPTPATAGSTVPAPTVTAPTVTAPTVTVVPPAASTATPSAAGQAAAAPSPVPAAEHQPAGQPAGMPVGTAAVAPISPQTATMAAPSSAAVPPASLMGMSAPLQSIPAPSVPAQSVPAPAWPTQSGGSGSAPAMTAAGIPAGTAVGAAAPVPPASVTATPTALNVNLSGPASAAVFARSGYLYAVFDRPADISQVRLVGPVEALVGPVETLTTNGGSAFRIGLPPWLRPSVERDGTVWRVVLTRGAVPPPQSLAIEPQPDFVLGPRLVVHANDARNIIAITDPEIGDPLLVVPLPVPGNAVAERHHYAQLELLPAFQGVVVRPIVEQINVRPVREGLELTTAGGLRLSPSTDARVVYDNPATMPPEERKLFNLTAWQHGTGPKNFTAARQKLQAAVINAPEDERSRARLDLARFYFSHYYGHEALGLLNMLAEEQKDLEGWPEFRALRGAVRTIANDPEQATADLANPALDSNPEATLWRAAAAAGRRDWTAASYGFTNSAQLLAAYPDPFFIPLSLMAIEAKLQKGERNDAAKLIDQVIARHADAETMPAMLFLRGEAHRQAGNGIRASELWRQAIDSGDRYYRARGSLALINMEVADGRMSPSEAADILESLRFAWRGDDLEQDILQRVGEMHMLAGNYFQGLRVMRETAAYFPDSLRSTAITEDMSRQFVGLFLKNGADKLPALDALALYDEFRELTPVAQQGDEIVRVLAERLVEIDLLERAAQLLQHQVEYRLKDLGKVKTGTRLAVIRLLDQKPEQALQALTLSNLPNIPPELANERRVLQARALAELRRDEEALTLLSGDDSQPANMLRVDIAWRSQRWAQAAQALGKVIGQPPANGAALNGDTARLVLNRAVALALAGDGDALAAVRRDFGPAMDKTPEANAFKVLTRPEQAAGLFDAATIRSRVAEVDMFKSFLDGYRNKGTAAKN